MKKETDLNHYIGGSQLQVIRAACKGEEGGYFRQMISALEKRITAMPKTYDTDGMGDAAPVTLHYFNGSSDWWIIERDAGDADDEIPDLQSQAFGFTCINGDKRNAELGYISIEELIRLGVEIDLYFTPKTLGETKEKLGLLHSSH